MTEVIFWYFQAHTIKRQAASTFSWKLDAMLKAGEITKGWEAMWERPWRWGHLGISATAKDPTKCSHERPQLTVCRAEPSQPKELCIIINCCFKPLGFGAVCYIAVDTWNTHWSSTFLNNAKPLYKVANIPPSSNVWVWEFP